MRGPGGSKLLLACGWSDEDDLSVLIFFSPFRRCHLTSSRFEQSRKLRFTSPLYSLLNLRTSSSTTSIEPADHQPLVAITTSASSRVVSYTSADLPTPSVTAALKNEQRQRNQPTFPIHPQFIPRTLSTFPEPTSSLSYQHRMTSSAIFRPIVLLARAKSTEHTSASSGSFMHF